MRLTNGRKAGSSKNSWIQDVRPGEGALNDARISADTSFRARVPVSSPGPGASGSQRTPENSVFARLLQRCHQRHALHGDRGGDLCRRHQHALGNRYLLRDHLALDSGLVALSAIGQKNRLWARVRNYGNKPATNVKV